MSLDPHAHQIYLHAICFFGVTSNQKPYDLENLVQSDDLKVAIPRRNCNCATRNVGKCDAELCGEAPGVCTAIRTPSFRYNFP